MGNTEKKRAILYSPDDNNLEKQCAGCRLCEMLCSMKHAQACHHLLSRIRIVSFTTSEHVPVSCHQCDEAPCIAVCPEGAISVDPELSIPLVDEEKCISCLECVLVCPFGAMGVDPDSGKVIKCDLCGGETLCVKYCPSQVLVLAEAEKTVEDQARISAQKRVKAWKIMSDENNQMGGSGR